MHQPMTCRFELPTGHRVEVTVEVIEEPAIPTPHEPDVHRDPALTEWPVIVQHLAKMDFTLTR